MHPGKCGNRLYDHTVPSIFPNFPANLQKVGTKWKSPKKRKYDFPKKRKYEEQPSCSSVSPSKLTKAVEPDNSYMKNVNISEQLNTYKKQVKALTEKVCQRNKRIKNMNELINKLKKEKLIFDEQHSLLEHNFSGVAEKFVPESNEQCKNYNIWASLHR